MFQANERPCPKGKKVSKRYNFICHSSRLLTRLIILSLGGSLAACNGGDSITPTTPSPPTPATTTAPSAPVFLCGTEPANVLRMFSKPFVGSFHLTNYFDHDLPLEFIYSNGYQLSTCGERIFGRIDGHSGYDWVMPTGTPLLAVADGEVIAAGTDPPFYCPLLDRTVTDTQFVEILHTAPGSERFSSVYVHVSRFDVQVGERVTTGQQIALSGNTGCSTEPHLHFHVWRLTNTNNGRSVRIDPYGWSGDGPDPWARHPDGAESVWLWREGEAPALAP